jgi:hypothetical protein
MHVDEELAPSAVLKVPAEQLVQAIPPAADEKVPAAHKEQSLRVVPPVMEENLPEGHGLQSRKLP